MSERSQLDLLVGRRVYDSGERKSGRVDEIRLVREGDRYEVEDHIIYRERMVSLEEKGFRTGLRREEIATVWSEG